MSYRVELDNISRTDWENQALHFQDYTIYQTWSYQENRARMDGQNLRRLMVRSGSGDVCLMAQVRVQNVPLLPFRVGYIQNGPLMCREGIVPADRIEIFRVMVRALFDDGIHVLRVVPNVVEDERGNDIAAALSAAGFKKAERKQPYHTFKVDVSDSEEAIRARLRKSFRRDLKNAEKSGLTVQAGSNDDCFSVLAQLYEESKGRKGFKGLEIEEFSVPQNELIASEKMKVFVACWENQPASALLSTELGDSAIVLLAASNQTGLEKGSSYLLWYQACLSAHSRGLKWCDLGGIDPDNNPSVFQFKSRMGGLEVRHIGTYDLCKGKVSQGLLQLIEKFKER